MSKTDQQLAMEMYQTFINEHPELTVQGGNLITQMMTSEKQIYARVAIDFAIKFMKDEYALKAKGRKKAE